MKRNTQQKNIKELRKKLIKNFKSSVNNIELIDSDFYDNRLTANSYNTLKEKIKKSNIKEQFIIIAPSIYKDDLLQDIEKYVSPEIVSLEKEMKKIKMTSLLLLLIGSIIFITANIFVEGRLMSEIAVVAFWVFVWGAVEKFFFELPSLRNAEYKLLRLADAEIRYKYNEEKI